MIRLLFYGCLRFPFPIVRISCLPAIAGRLFSFRIFYIAFHSKYDIIFYSIFREAINAAFKIT